MITPGDYAEVYTCRLTNANAPNEEYEIDLSGEHLIKFGQPLTNDDVESVDFVTYTTSIIAIPNLVFSTFKRLRSFYARNAELERIEPGTITNCEFLEALTVYQNKIRRLSNGVFKGCKSLESIDLSDNWISEIGDEVFADTLNLKSLRLSANHFSVVPQNTFKHLSGLKTLELDHNFLSEISENSFAGLDSLEEIGLGKNGIKTLPLCSFHSLQKIQRIYLTENFIEHIQPGTFALLPEIYSISVGNNLIKEIQAETFPATIAELILYYNKIERLNTNIFVSSPKPRLNYFRLDHNNINAIETTFFDDMPELRVLNMMNNTCVNQELDPNMIERIPEILNLCFENFEN